MANDHCVGENRRFAVSTGTMGSRASKGHSQATYSIVGIIGTIGKFSIIALSLIADKVYSPIPLLDGTFPLPQKL